MRYPVLHLARMPFSAEQQSRVVAALAQKVRQPCPSCGQQKTRQLMGDLYLFSAYESRPAAASYLPWGTSVFGGSTFENEMQSISELNGVALTCFSVCSFLVNVILAIVIDWGFSAPKALGARGHYDSQRRVLDRCLGVHIFAVRDMGNL